MNTPRRFSQVDVFCSDGFSGNPLAVVHDAEGITADQMAAVTRWTNLSEVTFLLAPTDPVADYRVRIFHQAGEFPFAGHPTLGSCRAWLDAGGTPHDPERIVQECGIGLVPIRRDGERLAFAAPPLVRSGPVDTEVLQERMAQLGLVDDDVVDAAWIDNGPGWMGILLGSVADVRDVPLPDGRLPGFHVGLVGLASPGSETDLEIRGLFADATGRVREDPVTGSLNASAAQWLIGSGRIDAPYVASQGSVLGRRGRVHVTPDESTDDLWIGGSTTVHVHGTITL